MSNEPASGQASPTDPGQTRASPGPHRPVTTWTCALNYSLGGLRPEGYHLLSNALHGLASWLVYLVLVASGLSAAAALTAALFAFLVRVRATFVGGAATRRRFLSASDRSRSCPSSRRRTRASATSAS